MPGTKLVVWPSGLLEVGDFRVVNLPLGNGLYRFIQYWMVYDGLPEDHEVGSGGNSVLTEFQPLVAKLVSHGSSPCGFGVFSRPEMWFCRDHVLFMENIWIPEVS